MKIQISELEELKLAFPIDWECVSENDIQLYEKKEISLLFQNVFIKERTKEELENLIMDMALFEKQTIDENEDIMFTMLQQINNIKWLESGRIARVIADDIF